MTKRMTVGTWRGAGLAAAAALAAGCVFGRGLSPFEPEARRLGIVMTFSQKAPEEGLEEIPRVLSEQLTRSLFDTKRMRVIDPYRLEAALKEMKLPVGVPLDAGTMAAVCAKLRAETAVFGQVIAVERRKKQGRRTSETLAVTVEAKLVLSSTTEVLSSALATGRSSISYREGETPKTTLLVTKALADASGQLAHQLVKDILPR